MTFVSDKVSKSEFRIVGSKARERKECDFIPSLLAHNTNRDQEWLLWLLYLLMGSDAMVLGQVLSQASTKCT